MRVSARLNSLTRVTPERSITGSQLIDYNSEEDDMHRTRYSFLAVVMALVLAGAAAASADPFFFSTGAPDGRMAAASRPESNGKIEIESADDFILAAETHLDQVSFTGLIFTG